MCKAKLFLSISMAVSLAAGAAQAEERLKMDIAGSGVAPSKGLALEVTGTGGRFDRAELRSAVLPLSLKAEVTDGDARTKIVSSRIYLKSEGADAGVDLATALEAGPSRRFDAQDIRQEALSANGPVAQDAIAACNRLPADTRSKDGGETVSMSVPVVWQVTTGRFNFNWRNYDRVGPSDEIVKNLDFYRDRADSQRETTVTAEVVCRLDGAKVAAKSEAKTPEKVAVTPKAEPQPKSKRKVALDPEPIAEAEPVKTAAVGEAMKPRCDGGMVRQSSSSGDYLCLCPGNTTRIAKGEDGFACVRPRRR